MRATNTNAHACPTIHYSPLNRYMSESASSRIIKKRADSQKDMRLIFCWLVSPYPLPSKEVILRTHTYLYAPKKKAKGGCPGEGRRRGIKRDRRKVHRGVHAQQNNKKGQTYQGEKREGENERKKGSERMV